MGMSVAEMWVVRIWLITGLLAVAGERENRAEEEVLYYWELAKYFC